MRKAGISQEASRPFKQSGILFLSSQDLIWKITTFGNGIPQGNSP
jgi:hypothetical protein